MSAAAEPSTVGPGSRTLRGRLLVAVARALAALPEAPLIAAADSIGELWYRTSPGRAAQARANLRRVCEGLAAQDRGSPPARRAATDPAALERLVRACFRHAARYYLEVARAGGYDVETAIARVDIETPAEIRDALMSGRPVILVGMHFGALELPAIYIAHLVGHHITCPMETVTEPDLARWFTETRARMGVTIVPLKDARRPLLAALRRGESVGLVNDRDVTGGGLPVPLFGHPAPISPGPALLALETRAPIYAGTCRRIKGGRYSAKLLAVPIPEEGTRRERLTALNGNLAAAFETLLADAPEQWWGAFHPIWPDLAVRPEGAGVDPDRPGPAAGPDRPGPAAGPAA